MLRSKICIGISYILFFSLVTIDGTACRSTSVRNSSGLLDGEEIKDTNPNPIELSKEMELKVQADMLRERQRRAERLAKLKELMARAKRELTGYDAILQKVFAFVRDREEGKRGPAKIIPIISWPGYGKTFFVEWIVDNLGLRDRYFYREAKDGDSYIGVQDMKENLKPAGERVRGLDGVLVTDEAQRIDTTPFDAEEYRVKEMEKINAELEKAYGPPTMPDGTPSQARARAQQSREDKLKEDIRMRQRRYEEDVQVRNESVYMIRTSTAGNGTVEVGGGVKPADHIAEIEKVVRAMLDAEVTGLSPNDQTKRNDLLREKDQLEKARDAKITEREAIPRTKTPPSNAERRKALTSEIDKIKRRITTIDGNLDKFGLDPTAQLAETERKLANLEAELEANNDKINELDADVDKEAKQIEKLERRNEEIDEEKTKLEQRIEDLQEGKDTQAQYFNDALEALKNALADYPELMDPFKDRIPERYKEASPHYFLLEAFRLDPTKTLDLLRKKAASLPPGQRKFAGGFLRLMLMNATEVQDAVKKLVRNPRDPDEVHRKAQEYVQTPEGKKLLRDLFKKIFGSTMDNDSLFSRVGDPEVIVPWDRATWKAYVRQQIKKNLQDFSKRLKEELGLRVDVRVTDSVVDLAYRMGANAEYGPRSMDNVYGVVLGEVKGEMEAHAIAKAGGDFDREFFFELGYDRASNKMQAFDLPTSARDIPAPAAGAPAVGTEGRTLIGDAVIAGGDTAKVPGEEAAAEQTDLARRLKAYRVSASAFAAILFFGSAPAGTVPGENGGPARNIGISLMDIEERDTVTKRWYPNPDIGINLWEYEMYTLLTRLAGVESDIIQVNTLSPESKQVLTEMEIDLPKFIENIQLAATQAGFFEGEGPEKRPSVGKFLHSVDRLLLREPLFQTLAKPIPQDPKSAEYKQYMEELLLRLRTAVRTRLNNQMMPLRVALSAGNLGFVPTPKMIDILASELQNKGTIDPARMTELFQKLYKRPIGFWHRLLLRPLSFIPGLKKVVNPLLEPVISLPEAGKWVQTGCRVLRGRQLMDRKRDANAAIYGKANANL